MRRSRGYVRGTIFLLYCLAYYDTFEGTAEIQQLVISRAISGMHIK